MKIVRLRIQPKKSFAKTLSDKIDMAVFCGCFWTRHSTFDLFLEAGCKMLQVNHRAAGVLTEKEDPWPPGRG